MITNKNIHSKILDVWMVTSANSIRNWSQFNTKKMQYAVQVSKEKKCEKIKKLNMESLKKLTISFIKEDYNKKYKITKFKKKTVFSVQKTQIKSFKYLGINITRNLSKEIKSQMTKITMIPGYLKDIERILKDIWRNSIWVSRIRTEYIRHI